MRAFAVLTDAAGCAVSRATGAFAGGGGGVLAVKVAVTVTSAPAVGWQIPVPVQPPPDQPLNVEPASAVAARATCTWPSKRWVQVEPHAIPAGVDSTVPDPVPFRTRVTV